MGTEGDDERTPLHAAIAEAMYDHGRWERPGPPSPALEWTVTLPAAKGRLRAALERVRLLLRR
jgi:hypothetical protein